MRKLLLLTVAGALTACSLTFALDLDVARSEKLPVGRVAEEWVYASETSAVIYWQTENRARSFVEYGDTLKCEERTPTSGVSAITKLPYWTQFHRITGLAPAKKYYYRMVCIGTDGKVVRGEAKTLETRRYSDAIRAPDDLAGPPYVLDRANATYLMTKDIRFPAGGFEVKAEGITLDMDGHTLIYNEEGVDGAAEWSERAYNGHDFGIKVSCRGPFTLLNGVIEQGKGDSSGTQVGIGCNPIYSRSAPVEMAGMEIIWSGKDVSGLFFHWGGDNHVHHCVMDDRGAHVTNRHQAISAIDGNVWGDYHHNLVKSTRQQALMGAVKATYNEVYINSFATNSFGIMPSAKAGKPVEVAHNKIIGIGEHPVGIAMFKVYQPGSVCHDNLVEVKCTRSGREYGYTGSACFRTTWGADNLDVYRNTFIAYGDAYNGKVAKARAVWVGLPYFTPKGAGAEVRDARGIFHENLIVARGRGNAKAGGICVVCLNMSPNLIFRNNTVISTWGNVLLSDEYGHADGYPKFVGNVFKRDGEAAAYHTIRQDYAGRPATAVFLDNKYAEGASEEDVRLMENGRIVFQKAIRILVKSRRGERIGGANVAISDGRGAEVFRGTTPTKTTEAMLISRETPTLSMKMFVNEDDRGYIDTVALGKGELRAILTSSIVSSAGKETMVPYRITVEKKGYKDESLTIDLSAARVEVTLAELR